MGEWYQRYLKLLPSPEARHAFVRVLRPMAQIKDADVSDDSDIHGVPKVPGQSSEDLAKQAFLQVIGIMKNVRQKKNFTYRKYFHSWSHANNYIQKYFPDASPKTMYKHYLLLFRYLFFALFYFVYSGVGEGECTSKGECTRALGTTNSEQDYFYSNKYIYLLIPRGGTRSV